MYSQFVGASDIEPAKLKRFLVAEAKVTKESRHERALKKKIPFESEVELNAAKNGQPARKKKKANSTSKSPATKTATKSSTAGGASPFDLKQVQGEFKKREPALLNLIGGRSSHVSAKGVGGTRDTLREYAKISGVSSSVYQGWVEMDEALAVQKLSERQTILTQQCLMTACGFVEYGSLEKGPSNYFYNSKCDVYFHVHLCVSFCMVVTLLYFQIVFF